MQEEEEDQDKKEELKSSIGFDTIDQSSSFLSDHNSI